MRNIRRRLYVLSGLIIEAVLMASFIYRVD